MVGTTADAATRSHAPHEAAAGLRPSGFDRAYEEVQRQIQRHWRLVQVYRGLTEIERAEGREIMARRYIGYRAATLRDIRMLRESVR